jgi:uncharacterized protein
MTTVATALWKRLDTPGHDFCLLEQEPFGWRLAGAAVFLDDSQPASISYSVRCGPDWEAVSGFVHGFLGSRRIDYVVTREDSVWLLNGDCVPGLEHLVDLDSSFTPATNLTQLRRVPLPRDRVVPAPVAWFELRSGVLRELPQVYQSRGERLVWYEAPSVGYRGLLELDASGFIQRYPALWQAETPSTILCKGTT